MILFVETSLSGHRLNYLCALVSIVGNENCVLLSPKENFEVPCKHITLEHYESNKRSLSMYIKMIKEIRDVIREIHPKSIHFVTGDILYRYFGVGLSLLTDCYIICTFHWIRMGKLEMLSTKIICGLCDTIVVHSPYLLKCLNRIKVKNAFSVLYPSFNRFSINKIDSCRYWGINPNIKTILCLGSTRYDKGIDILMRAMKYIDCPFQILVAGKKDYFSEDEIYSMCESYKNSVFLNLRYLSEKEIGFALGAADLIALPYRTIFNGASGPLCEGVNRYKCIIGTDYGNIGFLIKEYHLGYTFNIQDDDEIISVIKKAITEDFSIDDKYREYRESIQFNCFEREYKSIYKRYGECCDYR